MEEYWPWVRGICKCMGANARGFPGVNPPGWLLISALIFENWLVLILLRELILDGPILGGQETQLESVLLNR